jgi:hypothetical protein
LDYRKSADLSTVNLASRELLSSSFAPAAEFCPQQDFVLRENHKPEVCLHLRAFLFTRLEGCGPLADARGSVLAPNRDREGAGFGRNRLAG